MSLQRTYSGTKPRFHIPPGAVDTQLHMYLEGFPALPGGPPLPPGLPGPAEYRQVMAWLGIERLVITQGNAFQHDNSCLLACLEIMGPIARGVAVITPDMPMKQLQSLHDAGIRGARIMDLPGGAVGMKDLAAVDALAAAMGWCIAVQFDGNDIVQHLPALKALKSRYIIDHHGKFFAGATPDSAEVDALKSLIDRGNCWFKFSGCYESSRSGGPDYADIADVARHIAAHAPERLIWGSNWPHNMITRTEDYLDDAALLDLALSWVPPSGHKLILVDNPTELFGFDPLPL